MPLKIHFGAWGSGLPSTRGQAVDDRVGDRAAAAADRDREVRVVDLGVVVGAAEREEPVRRGRPVEVGLEAVALRLVGVEQGRGVVLAAHRHDLLAVDLVEEAGDVQAQLAGDLGLHADLERGDLLLVGDGDAVRRRVRAAFEVGAEEDAPLDRGRAEAGAHAAVEVDVLGRLVGGREVPGDEVGVGRDLDRAQGGQLEGRVGPLGGEVLLVGRVAEAALQVPAVGRPEVDRGEARPRGRRPGSGTRSPRAGCRERASCS